MRKVFKQELGRLWQTVSEQYELFLPLEQDGKVNFSPWKQGENVNFERLKTDIPPKNIIFPQTETYLKFNTDNNKLRFESVGGQNKEYVIFGVRPCDAVGFTILDNVFLQEPIDRFYEERRNKGIIISLACSDPDEACFCSSFGIAAEISPPGTDVAAWDIGDCILWQPQTEKGEVFTKNFENFLVEATDQDAVELNNLQQSIRDKLAALPLADVNPQRVPNNIDEIFESEIWQELSKACLGCGLCTYVCPTCHCYDIQDFDGGKNGERFRCWDSCMYSDFTRMAHGNPRKTQLARFRQRFMHKLVYYPNNYGVYACVGCGRCIEKCPVNMNIAKVINKMGGENNELQL